jgi:hypothetical protein
MSDKRFERRVGELLAEAATQVPSDLDLHQRIFERLYAAGSRAGLQAGASLPAPGRFPGSGTRRGHMALAGALVAALLVFSAFAFVRPLMLSWFGDSSLRAIALQDGTVIDRSVTVQGITLHLEEGYADAARTVLTMHISSENPKQSYSPVPYPPAGTPLPDHGVRLLDASGNAYMFFTSNQLNEDALWEFLPLPSEALGTPQELTFVVDAMSSQPSNPDNERAVVSGPWEITFRLKPQAGTVIALDIAPQTYGGITLLPERLDLTPAGVRLLVRESGLPPDTSVFSLKHFATRLDDVVACPPGQHVCARGGGTGDGASMQLRAPGGQTLVPGWVEVTSPAPQAGVPIGRQAVGPSGTAELAFLFFAPLKATSGTAHVTFDAVRLASTNPEDDERSIPGPWVFDLPLG